MSGVLSAVALLTNSIPILVDSMVIAPALSPLGLVAFALVRHEPRLALRGLGVSLIGFVLLMAFAVLTTYVLNLINVIPPETNLINKPLLEERVTPGWYSVAAAIAAGVAGSIALTKNRTDTLVGTVAALAPAVGAAAVALLSHRPIVALGGLALFGINAVLLIAMGVLALLVVRPGKNQ